jgi:ribosomal protein S18 acetylase RimI-like enzyme
MNPIHIELAPVTEGDFEELAGLRIAAMRESLERVGRFDPERARERLRSSFVPERTRFVVLAGERIGFVATQDGPDGLQLDHLYIHPGYQSRGIGSAVLKQVLAEADERRMAVLVGALKESASNRFYERHGFVLVSEGEWDNYYVRPPEG